MWFWFFIFTLLFLTFLINQFGRFPYYSYFDDKNTFWIQKYLYIKQPFDLGRVIKATLILRNVEDPTPYIELWTAEKLFRIRQAGLFCYMSNIELLNKIHQMYPNIDMNNAQLKKYMESINKKGFYVVDEHLNSYILLIVTFLFSLYFLYRSLFG